MTGHHFRCCVRCHPRRDRGMLVGVVLHARDWRIRLRQHPDRLTCRLRSHLRHRRWQHADWHSPVRSRRGADNPSVRVAEPRVPYAVQEHNTIVDDRHRLGRRRCHRGAVTVNAVRPGFGKAQFQRGEGAFALSTRMQLCVLSFTRAFSRKSDCKPEVVSAACPRRSHERWPSCARA